LQGGDLVGVLDSRLLGNDDDRKLTAGLNF
jgi:hypothetical protein